MARKIEQLLRAAADLHKFQSIPRSGAVKPGQDELSEEDLDFIAAATAAPIHAPAPEKKPE